MLCFFDSRTFSISLPIVEGVHHSFARLDGHCSCRHQESLKALCPRSDTCRRTNEKPEQLEMQETADLV